MKRLFVFVFSLFLIGVSITVGAQPLAGQNITRYFYDNQWHDYAVPSTYLEINGEKVTGDMPPIVLNDRSVVPARAVFEKLGATVSWDEKKSLVGINMQDINVQLTVNNKFAMVNGKKKEMEVPSKIINSTTMIPVRFVAETLGAKVDWNEADRMISIWYGTKPQESTNSIKINDIGYSQDGDKLLVKITADSVISSYLVTEWKEAQKLIINVNNAIMNVEGSTVEVNNNKVQRIRNSQYQINPFISRIVVDLTQWTTYEANLSEDRKQLLISFSNPTPDVNNETQSPGTSVDGVALDPKAKDKIVIVDPGHGGSDPGALGKDGNGNILVKEKDMNLSISQKLVELLKTAGVKVYTTREEDVAVDLYDRPALANNLNASLFVSVHNNAVEQPNYGGTMTLYHPTASGDGYGTTSKRLAELVQTELVAKLGTIDRGLRDGSMMAVIRKSNMPAIIAEIAFVTNPSDRSSLLTEEFRNKAAEALCVGIIKTLNESVQ